MITFVIQKLLQKKWMVISLLIGNILLVSITCCNPMYMKASLQKMLSRNLDQYMEETNLYPGAISVSSTFYRGGVANLESEFFKDGNNMGTNIQNMLPLPVLQVVKFKYAVDKEFAPDIVRTSNYTRKRATVGCLEGIQEHTKILYGSMYQSQPDKDGVIDCIVSQSTMVKLNLLLDEIVTMNRVFDTDGEKMRIRISGVFEASDEEDIYWASSPADYGNVFFIDETLYQEHIYDVKENTFMFSVAETVLYDYLAFTPEDTVKMQEVGEYLIAEAEKKASTICSVNYMDAIGDYNSRANNVKMTMWILQVPMFILLGAFIFMVSGQMIQMEQNEISVLKSRGVSKKQIVLVYLSQSVVISLVSLLIGVPCSYLLCKLLGATNTFMEFIGRKSMALSIDRTVILYGGIASFLSILMMTIPALKHAGLTIVEHKQRAKKKQKPFWQRMYLDVILFALSCYAYYNFNGQTEQIAERIQGGASLDPLIFLNSSLFVFSAGLLCLRLLPLLTEAVYRIGRRRWKPAEYASFLQIIRTRKKQTFICLFLMMTLATGILNAGIARTINKNAEDSLRYEIGADLVMMEKWKNNSYALEESPDTELTYYEPDETRYMRLEGNGADSVTKVFRDKEGSIKLNNTDINQVEILGINTKEFGETAVMKDGVLKEHFYTYLNQISQDTEGLLLSQSFADNFGLKVGDRISFTGENGKSSGGTVYGFVDAWPTFEKEIDVTGKDGVVTKTTHYLIIGHFYQFQRDFGVLPYEIWMKASGNTQFIYDFIEEEDIKLSMFKDAEKELVSARNDTVYQVTNGMLTINFIMTLLLCTVGFLIYWILSIRSRELLFGVYRAMGMSIKEFIRMLINEHVFISFFSLAFGAGIGALASVMFIPQIEMAYRVTKQVLPIEILINRDDLFRLGFIVGGMLIFCILVLGVLISKIKIAQALKLGED